MDLYDLFVFYERKIFRRLGGRLVAQRFFSGKAKYDCPAYPRQKFKIAEMLRRRQKKCSVSASLFPYNI